MSKTLVELFMDAPDHTIIVGSVGDTVGLAAGYPKSTEGRDAYAAGKRHVIDQCRIAVTDYRVFNLTNLFRSLMDTAFEAGIEVSQDPGCNVLLQTSSTISLPLTGIPRVGIHGWYNAIKGSAAVVALPHPTEKDVTHFYEVTYMDGDSDAPWFYITIGCSLKADGTSWSTVLGLDPYLPSFDASWGAKTPEERQELLLTLSQEHGEDGPLNQSMIQIKQSQTVLLINSHVNADPKIYKEVGTPAKVRRARGQSGRRTGTRAHGHILLPSINYKNGSWSSPGGNGLAPWRMVRGHERTFKDDRFTVMKGASIWIHPYAQGNKANGISNTPYKRGKNRPAA